MATIPLRRERVREKESEESGEIDGRGGGGGVRGGLELVPCFLVFPVFGRDVWFGVSVLFI